MRAFRPVRSRSTAVAQYKRLQVDQHEDVTVVHLTEPNPRDALLESELRNELMQLVETERPRKLLVNGDRVQGCPSAAISGLLGAKTRLAGEGQLKVYGDFHGELLRACRFLNLDGTVFDLYDSPTEAIASF